MFTSSKIAFLYDRSNAIKKTFITELNKYIALYGTISYFGNKRKKGVNIVNLRNKLSFLIDQKVNKEEIHLQLTKLDGKLAVVKKNKIENLAILNSNKKQIYWSEKNEK